MVTKRIEIIAIGDEVLRGETREQNAAFIGRALARAGLEVQRATSLPDDLAALRGAFREAAARSDIVIATGGLGPTVDDLTKEAVVGAFDLETTFREDIVREIEGRLSERGRSMPEAYRDQGRVPVGAEILPNAVGLAIGFRIAAGGCEIFLLPGVPAEMKAMLAESVLPSLGAPGTDFAVRLRTFGLTESEAEERLRGALSESELRATSIISSPTGVDLYFAKSGGEELAARAARRLGIFLYARGDDSLEEIVVRLLAAAGKTVATAESVTGGLIASTLVSVSGASAVFREAIVAYSDGSKIERLGVRKDTIARHGAVSRETCVEMVAGARARAGADYALATTGIAGPTGATPAKPVGLCFVALAATDRTFVRRFHLPGDRGTIRLRTAYHAIDILRLALIGAEDALAPHEIGSA